MTARHKHNHVVDAVEALRFRDPTDAVKLKFLELFKSHRSPAKALKLYKEDLQQENKDNYFNVIADRSICPDAQWVYRLYYSTLKKGLNSDKHVNKVGIDCTPISTSIQISPDTPEIDQTCLSNKHTPETDQTCLSYEHTSEPEKTCLSNEHAMETEQTCLSNKHTLETEQSCLSKRSVIIEDCEQKLSGVLNSIKLHLQRNPVIFADAINKFCSTYRSLKCERSKVSALYSFGRQKSYSPLRANRRTTISVQPTAIVQRKSTIKGRKCLQNGRPAINNFSAEHGYAMSNNPKFRIEDAFKAKKQQKKPLI